MTDKPHDSGHTIAQDTLVDLGETRSSPGEQVAEDDRLEWISRRRQAIVVEREALLTEDDLLWTEARQIRARTRVIARPDDVPASRGAAWNSPSRPMTGHGAWRPERVRDLLLWLGGALVALSALSLVAVLWSRDQPAGKPLLTAPRTAILLAVAILVTAVITRLIARRLPATAEVTATLVLALALTDWYVIRRAGVGDAMAIIGWMAIGSAVVAVIAVAQRPLFELRSPLVTAPLLGVVALGLAVTPFAHDGWTMAVTAAVTAFIFVVAASRLARSVDWKPSSAVVLTGAVLFTLAAIVAALAAVIDLANGRTDHNVSGVTAAVLMLALPFAAVLIWERQRLAESAGARDVVIGCITLAGLGAIAVLLASALPPVQFLAAFAWVGGAAVVAGRLGRRLGWGVVAAGAAALGAGSALAIARTADAVVAPLGWWSKPWSLALQVVAADHLTPATPPIFHDWWWAIAAALAVIATSVAVAVARSDRGRMPAVSVAIFAVLVTGVYLLPMAARLSVWWVLVIELLASAGAIAVAAVVDSRRRVVATTAAGVAVVIGLTASGWAVVAESGTIVFFATIATVAAIAAAIASTARFRRTMVAVAAAGGIATVGVVVAAVTNRASPTGVAIGCTAALALLVATTVRPARSAEFEVVAIVGLVTAVILTATSPTALAGVLTVATVSMVGGVLGGGAFAGGRRAYQLVLPILAAITIDFWLLAAGVSGVEAYTIPIGVSLLIVGGLLRHWDPTIGSWPAYVPGLVVALVPSLGVALDRGGTVRVFALVAASTIVLVAGARRRLQAPMLVAAAILLTLAADALKPAAVGLPRWIPLGATGLLILWIGATFERRMKTLRRVRHTIGTYH